MINRLPRPLATEPLPWSALDDQTLPAPARRPFLSLALAACAAPVSAGATPSTPVLGIDLGGASGAAMPTDAAPAHRHTTGKGEVVLAHAGHGQAQATGTVNAVDSTARKINVSHGPIAALGWPAMRMDFDVAPEVDLKALQPGRRINFTIEHAEGDRYIVRSIKPASGGR